MGKATKDTTVKEADVKVSKLSGLKDLEAAMLKECYKLANGEEHSIQQLLAYTRQAKKRKN